MHLQGGTNRSKCTFCSHSLERVRFKSREVSSDERLRGEVEVHVKTGLEGKSQHFSKII